MEMVIIMVYYVNLQNKLRSIEEARATCPLPSLHPRLTTIPYLQGLPPHTTCLPFLRELRCVMKVTKL